MKVPIGGRYLAELAGTFDEEISTPVPAMIVTYDIQPAVAPLYEVAAAHDGQPALPWLRLFLERMRSNDARG